MQIPLQITMREMDHSEAVDSAIQEQVGKLERFHERITRCRVTVEQLGRHQQQGRQFTVKVDLRIPGREIVACRDHHEDVYVALRDAFDSARRQLDELGR
jgi:ribosomal subunit interface protein